MRGIGVDGQTFVTVADVDEHVEIVGTHRRRARVDFVTKKNAKRLRVLAQL